MVAGCLRSAGEKAEVGEGTAWLTHLLRVEPVASVDADQLCARSAREDLGGVVGVSNCEARAAQRAAGGHRATIGELLSHGVSPQILVVSDTKLVVHKTRRTNSVFFDKLALNQLLWTQMIGPSSFRIFST